MTLGVVEVLQVIGRRMMLGKHSFTSMLGLCDRRWQRRGLDFVSGDVASVDLI